MAQYVKQFKGHGGGMVQLLQQAGIHFVSKAAKGVGASADMLIRLGEAGFNIPQIYYKNDNYFEMEFLDGVNMQNFITTASVKQIDRLIFFIVDYFDYCLLHSMEKDLSQPIIHKLESINTLRSFDRVNISIHDLYDHLPAYVPCSEVLHGDFTLDNIIYYDDHFYMIDANPTEINSICYDGNKLRQDLDCLWFVREEQNKTNYGVVCSEISQELKKRFDFMNDDSILIFMLLRILPYCKQKETEDFLIEEINKLCSKL